MLDWLTPAEWQAVRLSLVVSTVAVLASLPFGVALGWLLARGRFRGKAALETVVNLPLVMPPVVTGYLLLVTFGTQGWIGGWLERVFGIRVVFTLWGAALASAVVAFPLLVRTIRVAFTAVDPRLEQLARTLGARRLDTFFSISLPLAIQGVIAGGVLAFARSMGEFGATIMVAGNIPGSTRTIPLQVFTLLESPQGLSQATRIVFVSVAISAAALVVSEVLVRRAERRLAQGESL